VKVLDFGISKFTTSETAAAMTRTQGMMGSPLYMSPEQLGSPKDVDVRADVWAAGVILYQLLTNGFPFMAETFPELVLTVVSKPPTPIRPRRPDLPAQLEAVILRALEKQRDARFADVGELARALAPFGSRTAWGSVERIDMLLGAADGDDRTEMMNVGDMPTMLLGAGGGTTLSSWGGTKPQPVTLPTASTPSRSRTPIYAGSGALLVAALVGGFVASRGEDPKAPAAASEPKKAENAEPVETTPKPPAKVQPAKTVELEAPAASAAATGAPASPKPSASVAPVAKPVAAPKPAATPQPPALVPVPTAAPKPTTDDPVL
jgi:serine/threonine-protein kinase